MCCSLAKMFSQAATWTNGELAADFASSSQALETIPCEVGILCRNAGQIQQKQAKMGSGSTHQLCRHQRYQEAFCNQLLALLALATNKQGLGAWFGLQIPKQPMTRFCCLVWGPPCFLTQSCWDKTSENDFSVLMLRLWNGHSKEAHHCPIWLIHQNRFYSLVGVFCLKGNTFLIYLFYC